MKKKTFFIPFILFSIAALAITAAAILFVRFFSANSNDPFPEPTLSAKPVSEANPIPAFTVSPETVPLPTSSPDPVQMPQPAKGISTLYCTIWPVKDLDVYSNTSKENVIGTVPACGMYCVLEEDPETALFKIRVSAGVYGYIDSTYCLINLPEYIGDMCSYDITNSYSSLFKVHEYEIPGLTGKTIKGYENIRLADGSFLVPFLYPCTVKLISAAEQAADSGYRIKIYDAYRPKSATEYIYNTAMNILDVRLPTSTYSGIAVSLPPIPEPKEDEPPRDHLRYRDLIEQNGWDISAFLAPGWSRHNMGVALDMTFVENANGMEIAAQTNMHDLSAYSTIYSNNQAASVLYRIMESNDLHNIVSEWWHFQDNEAMNTLKPPYCENSVSCEGWIADGTGELYRNADGSIMKDCVMVTDEGSFVFDSSGHLVY